MATQKPQTKVASAKSAGDVSKFIFGLENFMIMFAGIAIMIIGYLCMSGGRQSPDKWNVNEIYSFTRISLSSILVIAGFIVVLYAVLKKRKVQS